MKFLNEDAYLGNRVMPSASVEDLLRARDDNRGRNRSHNSTYKTLAKDAVQIFVKVYGANKYESELFALASQQLSENKIEFFSLFWSLFWGGSYISPKTKSENFRTSFRLGFGRCHAS